MNNILQIIIISIFFILSAFGGLYMAKRKLKKMEMCEEDEDYKDFF